MMLKRSFSEHDQKRLGFGTLLCFFFIMAFTLSTIFEPCIGPLSLTVDFERPMASELRIVMNTQEVGEPSQSHTFVESLIPSIQNLSNSRSQVYEINGDVRIHGNSSTIFIPTTQQLNATSWTINPYARYFDKSAMKTVTNLTVTIQNPSTTPPCTQNFDDPAIVFSAKGYTGNPFHDFTDILIPLYLTSQQFNKRVILLISDNNSWWINKYKLILTMLSKYDVIDIHNQNEVLCFPRMIVGLKSHKELGMDPSTTEFTKFLRRTYSLDRALIQGIKKRRPRLLIISRKKTRHLRNEHDVAKLARKVGFEVSVGEMGPRVSLTARLVNGFDVMVAVHGAAITNMVFLPENGVVVQIVPCGLEVVSRGCFEIPSRGMNLKYLEYRVSVNESSLVEKYGMDNEVCRNPNSLGIRGWHEFRSVYLDNQDITVDLVRFRRTLLDAKRLVYS